MSKVELTHVCDVATVGQPREQRGAGIGRRGDFLFFGALVSDSKGFSSYWGYGGELYPPRAFKAKPRLDLLKKLQSLPE